LRLSSGVFATSEYATSIRISLRLFRGFIFLSRHVADWQTNSLHGAYSTETSVTIHRESLVDGASVSSAPSEGCQRFPLRVQRFLCGLVVESRITLHYIV